MATCALFLILASYAVLFAVRWGPAIWGGAPPLLPDGSPLGGDFAHFYAASVLAWAKNAVAVYSPPALQEIIQQVNGVKPPYFFPYPPTFLLILLPLALFSYVPSLLIWLTLTFLACLVVVYRIAPHPWTPWLTLAFPGVYLNFLTGQNGCLSASLLGGGLLLIVSFLASGPDDWLRKMPSLFAAARVAGLSFPFALILHGGLILAVAAGVAVSWHREAEAPSRNALLVLGILLVSPHLFYYDLALLVLPMAWIAWDGLKRGWLPGEPWLLLFCAFMPVLILVFVEIRVNIPIGVLTLGTLFWFTLRRQLSQGSALSSTIIPGSRPQT